LVTVAPSVCATEPVCGAESTGSLAASARVALAFATGVLRAFTTKVPPAAEVVVRVRSTPAKAASAARALTVSDPVLSAPQTGTVAQTLGATVTNSTTNWTARGAKVAVMCFGEARDPTTVTTTRLVPAKLKPGKQVAISVPLTLLCPTYLVAARAS
jgi:hypothetical protein